ncbi:hypothetical protein KIH39_26140 [Telmatocola sphagniphila]|uniref:Uncharacterized protein n=1 Tax=Telmatocola sphagniphila TaxID=1123043 RepID=A0A8E6B8C2_9BACT|nr:hypothetical protein [Telmatocola sphagniphila]QVL32270.1 hypothetical protein KIH39_26140 [Telmatocola sphagniphila]
MLAPFVLAAFVGLPWWPTLPTFELKAVFAAKVDTFGSKLVYLEDGSLEKNGSFLLVVSMAGNKGKIYWLLPGKSYSELIATLDFFPTAVLKHPTKNAILIGDYNGSIHYFDIEKKKVSSALKVHDTQIADLIYRNKNNQLITLGYDGKVVLLDLLKFQTEKTFQLTAQAFKVRGEKEYHLRTAVLAKEADLLYIGDENCTITVLDLKSGKLLRRYEEHTASVNKLILNKDGSKLFSFSQTGRIVSIDVKTSETKTIVNGFESGICDAFLLKESLYLTKESHLRIFNLDSKKQSYLAPPLGSNEFTNCIYGEDSKKSQFFALTTQDGMVYIYRIKD